ncbi:MAG: FAD:protein FMN transferase [Candidatus Marinimicrobia bacterium]|nr:FAD:protein FMN transferase [Candidatus Neomarinimicrobiota bacterium]
MNSPSSSIKAALLSLWILGLVLALGGCDGANTKLSEFSFNGSTMGTTYHITIVSDAINSSQRSTIASSVDNLLLNFNHILSTYDDQSEISIFNRNESTMPIPVSAELRHVVKTGFEFCAKSDGAFDITVMPIVNFFGFGFEPGENRFPNVYELDAWLQLTGCDKITIGDSSITKSDPRVSIDLSAIAKGDGVDHVSNFLLKMGYTNIFVEIGGEIMVHGTNSRGKPWKIGIDRPTFGGAPGADLQHVVQLTDMAIASSGDYRNYREVEGKRISHTIDPRSGAPISHNLAAVSVITGNCLNADGLATSVMVLGAEEGLLWLEKYADAEGLLIIREPDGSFQEYMTSGFHNYLAD